MAKKIGVEVDTAKLKKAAADIKSLKDEFNGLKDTLTKIKDAYGVAKSAADLLTEKTDVYKAKVKAGEEALKSYSAALEKLNALKEKDKSGKTEHLLSTAQTAYNKTQKEINNYTNKLQKAEKEQDDLNKELKETPPNLKQVQEGADSTGSALMAAFGEAGVAISATVGAIKTIISTIGNLAAKIKDAVAPQAEYIEDLNFLDNAFGEANNSGKQLLETLNQYVGYDPTTLVKQTAIFRQMGNALDMDAKVADTLATNLTKLAVDVKSITGQDLEKVASKFQSAMAGNVRAIRAYGVDVTQAALQQELLRLGIDEQVSSLTRAEKSVLTYLAMERQLATANGDLSQTVNSVSNQWEIFKNQVSQLGRLVGGFLIPVLKAVLPVLNGIIMALNTIISMVMSFFGIDAESFAAEFGSVSSGVDDLTDSFDDMASSAGKAGKAAKEAQKSLRGFDKLNNITTPTSSSSGSGGGGGVSGGIGAINPKLLDALKGYNLHLDEMNNWATKIKDKIMGWLGFTKLVDEKTGEITYKFGGFHKLAQSLDSSPIATYYKMLYLITNPLNIIPIKLEEVLIRNDEVWNGVKEKISETFKAIDPLFEFFSKKIIPDVGNALKWLHDNIIKPFSEFLDRVFTDVWLNIIIPAWDRINKEILPPLIELLDKLWNKVLVPLGNLLGEVLKPIIDALIARLEWLWKNILQPIVNFIVNNVIDTIKRNITILSKIIDVLGSFIEKVVRGKEKVAEFVNGAKDKIGELKTKFDEKFKPIKNLIQGIIDKFNDLKNAVKNFDIGKAVSGVGSSIMGFFGLKAGGGLYEGGQWKPMHAYAGGGFPSHGELFLARETSGPELVGKIGSSTAVLNNNQILDQMSIAVARGMAAGGGQEKPTNIIAKGDTKGLLDFIKFEQISNNRQFGL